VRWATILTGVWPGPHGGLGNVEQLSRVHRYPERLATAFCGRPALRPHGAASALILGTEFEPGAPSGPRVGPGDRERRRAHPGHLTEADPIIVEAAEHHLRVNDPDLAFGCLGEADQIAHEHGVGAEYEAAVLRQDQRLGRLLSALSNRPTWSSEQWLVIVTTDHGHLDEGGHGGGSWEERQSFVVAAMVGGCSPTRTADSWAESAENIDIAPTALSHLGVPPAERHGGKDLCT